VASKWVCKQCRDYYPKELMVTVKVGKFCNKTCMIAWSIENSHIGKKKISEEIEKINKKERLKEKRENNKLKGKFYGQDLKTRKNAAKEICHLYIRTRDDKEPCICCNKPNTKSSQAGHYLPSGMNPLIRYDEDNISLQKINCNYYKGGDSGDYRTNLIKKIGIERVERLENMKGGQVKWTADMYKEIEDYYKQKLKDLLNTRLGE